MTKKKLPPPSWEAFDECLTCGVGPKKPCCKLNVSTRKGLREANTPHKGRKFLEENEAQT